MCRGIEKLKLGLLLVVGALTLSGCGAEVSAPAAESEVVESVVESIEQIMTEESSISVVVNETVDVESETVVESEINLEEGTVALSDEIGIISGSVDSLTVETMQDATVQGTEATGLEIPPYAGEAFVALNGNLPFFTEAELVTTSFEYYSPLDALGRCGVTYACIGTDIMPTEERGNIGQIKPTGWHTVKYEGIDGNYLYNRCHLIGYQLTGENANEQNLITGTRYMNVEGMLPFENMVADYVKETGNHVLYRVTPIFEGDNLLATGVQMEAMSVEDKGEGILFHVFVYNVQPGIAINYTDGSSSVGEGVAQATMVAPEDVIPNADQTGNEVSVTAPVVEPSTTVVGTEYVLNINTDKFHYPSCGSAKKIKEKNRREYTGTREELIAQGYDPCGNCEP